MILISRFYFIDSNCEYKYNKPDKILKFRFNYRKNLENPVLTGDGTKYRLATCTLNKLPFIVDKIVGLRFNVVVGKYIWNRFKQEIENFHNFYNSETTDVYHNSSLVLKDDKYIELTIPNLELNESLWWISQTRKSKVISSFNTQEYPLPFSRCLEIYFSMFVLREDLDDDEDFIDIDHEYQINLDEIFFF